jgi:outer membrane protein OmpA-like peptidoglycan-associated protein
MKNNIKKLSLLMLCLFISFSTLSALEKISEEVKTKKEIKKILESIKDNNKTAQNLFDEVLVITENLKYTARHRLRFLSYTIDREIKKGKTEKDKISKALKVKKKARKLYYQMKYREVIKIVNEALRLVSSVPLVILNVSPSIFSPDGDNINDTVTFTYSVFTKNQYKVKNWKLIIKKRNKKDEKKSIEVFTFSGKGMPYSQQAIVWDGKKDGKLVVDSFNNYMAEMIVVDNNGEGSSGNTLFQTDIFVENTPYGMRVNVSAIQFKYNSAVINPSYYDLINRIHSFLLEYPEYRFIAVEGHTDYDNYIISYRLSQDRAASVKKVLVKQGMKSQRIITKGFGNSQPFTKVWKKRALNRRVTFVLIKSKDELKKYKEHYKSVTSKHKPNFQKK